MGSLSWWYSQGVKAFVVDKLTALRYRKSKLFLVEQRKWCPVESLMARSKTTEMESINLAVISNYYLALDLQLRYNYPFSRFLHLSPIACFPATFTFFPLSHTMDEGYGKVMGLYIIP
jgi:hypothetical protein